MRNDEHVEVSWWDILGHHTPNSENFTDRRALLQDSWHPSLASLTVIAQTDQVGQAGRSPVM